MNTVYLIFYGNDTNILKFSKMNPLYFCQIIHYTFHSVYIYKHQYDLLHEIKHF